MTNMSRLSGTHEPRPNGAHEAGVKDGPLARSGEVRSGEGTSSNGTPSNGTPVSLADIRKSFGTNAVLTDITLDIAPGEFVSLLGPSGCGKTTLLRVVAGLENADSGTVAFAGTNVSNLPINKRDIGMVFQSYSLFPHLNVLENTAFGLRRRGVGKAEARQRALDVLTLVGLEDLSERYPHQMSGGQQQRVALARALVTEPRVLLLDEPLSALDAKVRVQLRDEIRRIQLRLGITTIFVTHDQEEALAISDRIAIMEGGRIEQIGTPEELYSAPASPIVASFVGLSSVVSGVASGSSVTVWGTKIPLIGDDDATGNVRVYIRPENVSFADSSLGTGVGAGGLSAGVVGSANDAGAVGSAANAVGITGTVEESSFLGSSRRTLVRTEVDELAWVQHAPSIRPRFGERVRLVVAAEPVCLA
ncbi:MAG: ABC transporter ATP-binding protein [Ancrocorticia sp.]